MTAGLFAVAAAAGAVARWQLGRLNRPGRAWGTFIANVAAAFLLGALVGSSASTVTIVGVGHLGSLSTFSGVSREVLDLDRLGRRADAVGYVFATVVAGVAAAAIGLTL